MKFFVVVRHLFSRFAAPLAWKPARRRSSFGRLQIQQLEERRNFAADLESFDGSGNNLVNPNWGSAGSDLLRIAPAQYGDGISTPAGADRPSARAISDVISAQADDLLNNRNLTAFVYAWGQFLDHDLDLTTSGTPRESFNVPVPAGDPQFDPSGTGTQIIPLSRSAYDSATGTSAANPRQQVNSISSFLDGSQVYGSDAARAAALRTFSGGHMKTSDGNMLPFNPAGLANANDAHLVSDDKLYLAGDVRANENIELLSMQTLFVREHNRVADEIAKRNPTWNDEQIYQEARRTVIGELQVITYKEFLPSLLGRDALKPYTGYHANVNPGISNEFSTAAFRLGHSMLGPDIEFLDNDGNPIHDPIELRDAFFNPAALQQTGIDSILKYLASDKAQEIDVKAVDDVRNFLFGPPGAGGFDLISLNIQRGRDHGLADYNSLRVAYGLPKVQTFADITPDKDLQQKLQNLYGSVDKIDAWVGGLAEKHLPGSSLGPLFQRILVDQFTRLRDGDRFWYQNQFSGEALKRIESTTLADVIRRNTTTTNLQQNVFTLFTSVVGAVYDDRNQNGKLDPSDLGLAGIELKLLDAAGNVVSTTRTDREGRYHFDDLDLGKYTVSETVPNGGKPSTVTKVDLAITRGMEVRIDFGLVKAPPSKPVDPPLPPKPQPPPPAPPPKPLLQQAATLQSLGGMNGTPTAGTAVQKPATPPAAPPQSIGSQSQPSLAKAQPPKAPPPSPTTAAKPGQPPKKS